MLKVSSALICGTKILKESDTPRLDCEVILGHVLGFNRLRLIVENGMDLNDKQYEKFKELVDRRAKGEPIAYIVGNKEFMSLDFVVCPGVLIPRGDTETIVQIAIKECQNRQGIVNVVDVGCGSGAIGISIAKYAQNSVVTLIDISDISTCVTKTNAEINNVLDRVRITQGNLLLPVFDEKYDIIISNPPYIETSVIKTLQTDVKDFEPIIALDGGEDGLEFYKKIIPQALECLQNNGVIIFEIGYNQAESVSKILKYNGFKDIEVFKDLGGNDRCVVGRKC